MQKQGQLYILTAVMLCGAIALGLILYFVGAPHLRLSLGWLMLAPIIFGGARLGVAEHVLRVLNPTRYPRRFLQLRSHVEELLGEIRRLNRIAVDARRGAREQGEATKIMDAIEERLKGLIGEIRAVAGDESHCGPHEAALNPSKPRGRSSLSGT